VSGHSTKTLTAAPRESKLVFSLLCVANKKSCDNNPKQCLLLELNSKEIYGSLIPKARNNMFLLVKLTKILLKGQINQNFDISALAI